MNSHPSGISGCANNKKKAKCELRECGCDYANDYKYENECVWDALTVRFCSYKPL